MFRARLLLPAALLLAGLTGCSTARFVRSTSDGGVVAIPSNSNYWPFYHRDAAERLMAQKCPNGYEVVEEQEVVVGQKQTTSQTVDRQNLGAKNGNRERSTASQVTSVADQTEYRITFRSKSPGAAGGVTRTSGLDGLPPQPTPVTD